MEPNEYRAVIRFLYLKGCTPKVAFDEIKTVYGEYTPSYDVKHWHSEFKCGHTSVETVPIPGRPQSAIDDATIQQEGGPLMWMMPLHLNKKSDYDMIHIKGRQPHKFGIIISIIALA